MSNDTLNTIDAAIAKAKANITDKSAKPTRKEKLSPEQKSAAKESRQQAREAEKAAKKAARAAKKAAREASRPRGILPGTARLATAEARLPAATEGVSTALANVFSENLTETETVALIAHLQHALRARQTVKAATGTDVAEGQTVRVIAGEARFVGKVGTVVKVSRIRCHVQVPGRDKPLYLFTSDVAEVTPEIEATGTDG